MNIKFAKIPGGKLFFSLLLALCAAGVSSVWARKDDDRPEWVASPKNSDNMYIYTVGHAEYQASATDAQEAAMKDAKIRLGNQIGGFAVDFPISKLRGVEVMPGCVHVEEYRGDYECWVQVSYPVAEKNKLLSQMEEKEDSENASEKQDQPVRREMSDDSSGGGDIMFMKDDSGNTKTGGDSSGGGDGETATGGKKPMQKAGSDNDVSATGAGKEDGGGGGGGGASGTYPAEPFNRLQLRYSVSGATLEKPEDKDGFTCVRSFKGKLNSGGELVVSGSSSDINGVVNTDYGNFAQICDVEAWVGNNKQSFHSKKPHEEAKGRGKNEEIHYGSAYFELKIPIEDGDASGGFRIEMTYVNPRFGDRGLVVCGTLSSANGGASSDGQGTKDPTTKETYKGDPNPQSDEETVAWTLYRRYKAQRKKIDDLKSGVSNKQKDISAVSYGFGSVVAVDKGDLQEKSDMRNKLAEAQEQLKMIESAWDEKFSGYYGSLSDSDQTITTTYFDPNKPLEMQNASMDLIEFRLRSFHNLKKAKEQVQKQQE